MTEPFSKPKDSAPAPSATPHFWRNLALIFLGVFIAWLLYPHLTQFLADQGILYLATESSFEGADSFFAAMAFAGLIFAILLQRRELVLQREELAATREELAGQRLQLERQGDLLASQQFTDSFYKLLDFHATNVRNMTFGSDGHNRGYRDVGRAVFDRIATDLIGSPLGSGTANQRRAVAKVFITQLVRETGVDVTYYLNTITALLLSLEGVTPADERRALRALRALLSQSELRVIHYHIVVLEEEFSLLRRLVEKHGLLASMKRTEDSDSLGLLSDSAYQLGANEGEGS